MELYKLVSVYAYKVHKQPTVHYNPQGWREEKTSAPASESLKRILLLQERLNTFTGGLQVSNSKCNRMHNCSKLQGAFFNRNDNLKPDIDVHLNKITCTHTPTHTHTHTTPPPRHLTAKRNGCRQNYIPNSVKLCDERMEFGKPTLGDAGSPFLCWQ